MGLDGVIERHGSAGDGRHIYLGGQGEDERWRWECSLFGNNLVLMRLNSEPLFVSVQELEGGRGLVTVRAGSDEGSVVATWVLPF